MSTKNKRTSSQWKRNTLNAAVALAISGMCAAPAWSDVLVCSDPISSTIGACDASGVSPLTVTSNGKVISSGHSAIYYLGMLDGSLTNNGTVAAGLLGTVSSAAGVYIHGVLSGTLSNSGSIGATAHSSAYSVLAAGVVGEDSFTGSLTNSGTISGNADGGYNAGASGIFINGDLNSLSNSGMIMGHASSAINAYAAGLVVTNNLTGALTNHGTIAGVATNDGNASATGIAIGSSLLGTLTNSGTISATAHSYSEEAYASGVYLGYVGSAGSLTNNGAILAQATGESTVAAAGIYVSESMDGKLTNTGTISAKAYSTSSNDAFAHGVLIDSTLGSTGSLSNSGTITAQATAYNNAFAYGVDIGGIYGGYLDGMLSNSGTISAMALSTSEEAFAYGVYVAGGLGGGTLSNSGTISAAATGTWAYAYGVYVNTGMDSTGSMTNNGTISASALAHSEADAYGVIISGNMDGTLSNGGTISATAQSTEDYAYAYGVSVYGDLNGTLSNGGSILAKETAWYSGSASGIYVGGNLNGTLTNDGTISATALSTPPSDYNATAYGINIRYGFGSSGVLTNNGTISASAEVGGDAYAYGVIIDGGEGYSNMDGTLTNNGTISATALSYSSDAYAYGVYLGGTMGSTGSLTNMGTISATATASTDSLAYAYGVYINGSMDGMLSNGGTISATATASTHAYAYGIYIDGSQSGTLTNDGAIMATALSYTEDAWAYGVDINGDMGSTGSLTNNGAITVSSTASSIARAYGVYVNGSMAAMLGNNGTISATANASGLYASAYGIYVYGDMASTGSLTNGGTISAVANGFTDANAYGVFLDGGEGNNIDGTLTNTGTISASAISAHDSATAIGIYVNGDLSNTGGALTNTGLIMASATARTWAEAYGVDFGNLYGTLTNDGTISATAIASRGDASAEGISMSNLDSSDSLTNNGTISASATATTWAGAWGINMGAVFGPLTNDGTISAMAISSHSDASAYGIEMGTLFSGGSLSNSGTISASATARTWAGAWGIYMGEEHGPLTNDGTISAMAISSHLDASAYGIEMNGSIYSGGSLTNNGTISADAQGKTWVGAYGINVTGSIYSGGSLSNNGTIAAAANSTGFNSYASAYGILMGGSINSTGSLTNMGVITAHATGPTWANATGIWMNGSLSSGGTLTNEGTISAVAKINGNNPLPYANWNAAGAVGVGMSGSLDGTMTNSGTISARATGMGVNSTTWAAGVCVCSSGYLSGSLTNSGIISGVSNVARNGYSIWVDGGEAAPAIVLVGPVILLPSGSIDNTASGALLGNLYLNGPINVTNDGIIYIPTGANMNLPTPTSWRSDGGSNAYIGGDYTQGATGVLGFGVTGAHQDILGAPVVNNLDVYGQLVVNGTADLSAANNTIVEHPVIGHTLAVGDVLPDVVSAGDLVLASGDAITVVNSNPLATFTGVRDGNTIDLTVTSATTMNALYGQLGGLGNLLDSTGGNYTGNPNMDTLLDALNGDSGGQWTGIMQDLQPLMSSEMNQVTFGILNNTNNAIHAHQDHQHGSSSGDSFVTNRNAWAKILGATDKQDDSGLVLGYKANTGGFMVGLDGDLSSTSSIGLALVYTSTNVDSNGSHQTAKMTGYQLVGYGSHQFDGDYYMDWQADVGTTSNDGNRYINYLKQSASASYDSSSFHLGARVGRAVSISQSTTFTPSLHADYTSIKEGDYTDSIATHVQGRTTSQFIIGAAGRFSFAMSDTARLIADLGLDYDTQNRTDSLNTTLPGGSPAFTAQGIAPSRTTFIGGLGLVFSASQSAELSARYDISSRSGYTAQSLSLKLRVPF